MEPASGGREPPVASDSKARGPREETPGTKSERERERDEDDDSPLNEAALTRFRLAWRI